LLEKNPDKIDWSNLSKNPTKGAMQLLKNHSNNILINWHYLSRNPHIFNYDYKKMKQNCLIFKEDLMKNRYHPCNISKFKYWKVDGFE